MTLSLKRPNRRQFAYPILAMLIGLSPFLVLETVLRVAGIARPQSDADPFVGFSAIHPLFEKDERAGVYRTAPSRLQFFAEQKFHIDKPSDGFRAFCFGGSTVLGHPYQPDTAFSEWLEIELQACGPWSECEVVNCGGISYASYRLVPILQETLAYSPDLIVVATGHNEFLEDRTYQSLKQRSAFTKWISDQLYSLHTVHLAVQGSTRFFPSSKPVLPEEVDARLDHESGYASYHRDQAWQEQVLEHYRTNLQRMAALCRQAGVPLIFVELGSNIRDCPPFKSEHRDSMTVEELATWQAAFDEATQLEPEDPGRALELYTKCQQLDPEYALVAYRIGRCYDRLKNPQAAKEHYLLAKDLDVCPLRMLEKTHEILREVAKQESVPLVDGRSLLEKESPDGLAGSNIFLDHVHPDIYGHQLTARALAEQVKQEFNVSWRSWPEPERLKRYRDHLEKLGQIYLAQGRLRVEWLEDWARRDRLADDTEPWDLRGELEVASRMQDFGRPERAMGIYEVALERTEDAGPLIIHRIDCLYQQGRFAEARQVGELLVRHGGPFKDAAEDILRKIEQIEQ